MNACSEVLSLNLAKASEMNQDNHYMCSDCGLFCNDRKKTFACLPNVRYYNVMFYTH